MSDERTQKPLPEEQLSRETASPEKATSLEKAPPSPSGPGVPSPEASSPGVSSAPALRASDADRERVVERLRDAVAEGRLDMEEFQERLEAAYASRTYAELEPLTRDLPAPGATGLPAGAPATDHGSASWPERIGGAGTSSTAVAVMSGFQRKGQWTVPGRFNAVAFWGGGELDLREASFSQREVVINCFAVMGGIQITVPPGVEVDVRGIGVMGAFDQRGTPGPLQPGAPRVVVTGLAFWGGVEIKIKPPKPPKPQRTTDRRPRKEL
ncbi:DUF1707 domain-containing protein [Streptomyces sp. NBC_01565]|uniref:DUF1707 SHOCT-like domain-containing protein n=1 Tax=Streptomyces sp. NBC_01565 TaxID=2975881 RepID=UPI002B1CD781|nr:DUF1707 domain-containing protein [Streptomyces sp. NBC_01565]